MSDVGHIGPTAAEMVALVRLADDPQALPPSYLRSLLLEKGWIASRDADGVRLTVAGRMLAEQADTIDLDQLSGIPAQWASWREVAPA